MPIGKIDELVQGVLGHVRARKPQSIDQVFDSLPVNLNDQILNGVLADLSDDIDSLAWLCGYFASEINSSEDNDIIAQTNNIAIQIVDKAWDASV